MGWTLRCSQGRCQRVLLQIEVGVKSCAVVKVRSLNFFSGLFVVHAPKWWGGEGSVGKTWAGINKPNMSLADEKQNRS